MARKALMGIEYITIIGILLLIPTLTGSLPDPDTGSGTDGTDPGDTPGPQPTSIQPTGGYSPRQKMLTITATDRQLNEYAPTYTRTTSGARTLTLIETKIDGTLSVRSAPTEASSLVKGDIISIPLATDVPMRLIITATEPQGPVQIDAKAVEPALERQSTELLQADGRSFLEMVEVTAPSTGLHTALRFTLSEQEIALANSEPRNVVVTEFTLDQQGRLQKKANVPTFLLYSTPDIIRHTTYYVYEATLPGFSYFVINAKQIVRPPSLCNNNGVCEVPEGPATCPGDCFAGAPRTICQEGEKLCISNVLYACASGGEDILKQEVCTFGCQEGACLSEPTSQVPNTIFLILIAFTTIIALVIGAMFLRK